MKKYNTVFLDLDGTIIDSGEGVTSSVKYALERLGIEVADKKQLSCFIGPPLIESFKMFYGFDEQTAIKAVALYREYYTEKGIYEGYIYDGVEQMLTDLKNAGLRIVLATSKPEQFAVKILEGADLAKYFDIIAGASLDERTRSTKSQVIEYALEMANIDTPSDVIMVGDRFYDVEGAREFGIDCIGVLYGYGSREEMEKHGAAYIVSTTQQVTELLLSDN